MTAHEIKEALLALGMDKKEFAAELGVSPRTLEGWLQNRPPSNTAIKLIQAALLVKAGKSDSEIKSALKAQSGTK